MSRSFFRFLAVFQLFVASAISFAQTPWQAGLARVDVTPTEPVRMSGYGSRDHPSEGIDTPLYARCLALRHQTQTEPPLLMITVDSIGIPGSMSRALTEAIKNRHGIPRERIVICSTHTHTGPDLISELTNIFTTPPNEEETAAGLRYKAQLSEGILKSVLLAIADMASAELAYDIGVATFAANRRVLIDGKWSGFGIQTDGPVDHSVPTLRINGADGSLRGVVFNYACHGTTLGGNHYNINAEWCGYACDSLESKHVGAIAMCTIGCGADANPNPKGTVDAAKIHGRTLAAEVDRLLDGPMNNVDEPVVPAFDYAALSFDLPTEDELQQPPADASPQAKRHARKLLEDYKRDGRLPATYPVPIQAWQFGEQLKMVFIGGEVVVDYAIRLKNQLNEPDLWVSAYANNVLGYIASERMRHEGGYEYDKSGAYYSLPGPWAAGTEDLLIRRIENLLTTKQNSRPLLPDDAKNSIQVPDGFHVELVAAEPVVQDPINIAFGSDGKLWVVEMGDYPEGNDGGRIKWLSDTDGDGAYDSATVFLSDIAFPTGVFPWRDGVLISAAPDIHFARDTNGDGKADDVKTLYTGFKLANPQHRIGGFSYGLDHSLHLSSGDNLDQIRSVVTGQTVDASGHDIKIWPDTGRIETTSGRTQYIRSRNDWGEWFGNDNSKPMYHFPIDDRYLRRNPAVTFSQNARQLFDPPVAPPVFPITAATERFNDLFAANRFTSACSTIVSRSPHFNVDSRDVAFVCEPVHNLVHRAVLTSQGASYVATRAKSESKSEFLASSDPWFRPARVCIGPAGMLWVVDMYRQTIEHPKWIPESWQQQLDLRAGEDRGRIYRIVADKAVPTRPIDMTHMTTSELVAKLNSPIGTIRDLAQQLIIERADNEATLPLIELANSTDNPQARVHALSILDMRSALSDDILAAALRAKEAGVLLVAIRLAEARLDDSSKLLDELWVTARHADQRVVLQTALALGESSDPRCGQILGDVACRTDLDPWTALAVSSSARNHAETIVRKMFSEFSRDRDVIGGTRKMLLFDLLVTAQAGGIDIAADYSDQLEGMSENIGTQIEVASTFCRVMQKSKQQKKSLRRFEPLYRQAIKIVVDPNRDDSLRCQAIDLLGMGIGSAEHESNLLCDLIGPATPTTVQQRAIDRVTYFSPDAAYPKLIGRWPSMTKTIRDHFISIVVTRQNATAMLLDAIAAEQVKVNDLSPAIRQQLTRTGTRPMRVRAERLLRTTGTLQKSSLVRSYLAELNGHRDAGPGDVEQGGSAFKQHCAVCHVPDKNGQTVGASLDNLTDRRDEALLTAILDPNLAVDPKYQGYAIETDDGRILVGAIENEVGDSITLAHADGQRSVIRRDQIAAIKNTGVSLMPEGMETVLSHATMRNLLAYLQQQRSP